MIFSRSAWATTKFAWLVSSPGYESSMRHYETKVRLVSVFILILYSIHGCLGSISCQTAMCCVTKSRPIKVRKEKRKSIIPGSNGRSSSSTTTHAPPSPHSGRCRAPPLQHLFPAHPRFFPPTAVAVACSSPFPPHPSASLPTPSHSPATLTRPTDCCLPTTSSGYCSRPHLPRRHSAGRGTSSQ